MALQAGDRRAPHLCSLLPKLSCHLTQHAETAFTLLLILRNYLHHNHLTFPFIIPSIQFESSAIDLTVFSIGVGLLILCLLSLLSLVHIIVTLGVERVRNFFLRPQDIQLRVRWLVCVLGLLPFSCIYTVWLFFFVREKWSSNFDETVQILHLIPTGVFLLHTVVKVVILICIYPLTDGFNNNTREDVVTHVRVVKSVNQVFILYCVSILFIAYDEFNASLVSLLLSELLFRLAFGASANDLERKIQPEDVHVPIQEDVHVPIEEDVHVPQEDVHVNIQDVHVPVQIQAENLPVPGEDVAVANFLSANPYIISLKYLAEHSLEYELCGKLRTELVFPAHGYEVPPLNFVEGNEA